MAEQTGSRNFSLFNTADDANLIEEVWKKWEYRDTEREKSTPRRESSKSLERHPVT